MHEPELLEARRILHHHADLLRTERSCLADLLLSVAEFEERGLHRALGHATLFDYLHRSLSMSKGMAHYRMVGARLIRRFPEVEGPVRDGRLCLTTVVELARVMTEENRSEVLPRFFGLSRQEARQVARSGPPRRGEAGMRNAARSLARYGSIHGRAPDGHGEPAAHHREP